MILFTGASFVHGPSAINASSVISDISTTSSLSFPTPSFASPPPRRKRKKPEAQFDLSVKVPRVSEVGLTDTILQHTPSPVIRTRAKRPKIGPEDFTGIDFETPIAEPLVDSALEDKSPEVRKRRAKKEQKSGNFDFSGIDYETPNPSPALAKQSSQGEKEMVQELEKSKSRMEPDLTVVNPTPAGLHRQRRKDRIKDRINSKDFSGIDIETPNASAFVEDRVESPLQQQDPKFSLIEQLRLRRNDQMKDPINTSALGLRSEIQEQELSVKQVTNLSMASKASPEVRVRQRRSKKIGVEELSVLDITAQPNSIHLEPLDKTGQVASFHKPDKSELNISGQRNDTLVNKSGPISSLQKQDTDITLAPSPAKRQRRARKDQSWDLSVADITAEKSQKEETNRSSSRRVSKDASKLPAKDSPRIAAEESVDQGSQVATPQLRSRRSKASKRESMDLSVEDITLTEDLVAEQQQDEKVRNTGKIYLG